jgi:hypothetical protein
MLAALIAIPVSQPIFLALGTTLSVFLFESDKRSAAPAA